MGNTFGRKYSRCDFCGSSPKNHNPYVFRVEGLGKHDGKVICSYCLQGKIDKGNKQKKEEKLKILKENYNLKKK
tara:strand:+ start:91 stop:312 length:222 start_codon:yes stop_codon:yes gene_type:complete